jgi:hypothetical protein
MNRRGFLGLLAAAVPAGVFGLPAVKAAPVKSIVDEVPKAPPLSGNDALIPELWAKRSLEILQENMVMSNLVNRDYRDRLGECKDRVRIGR